MLPAFGRDVDVAGAGEGSGAAAIGLVYGKGSGGREWDAHPEHLLLEDPWH